jgi:P4 family phage/plasmid primase-like protien
MSTSDQIDALALFRAAMLPRGLSPGEIIQDGEIHRFRTEDGKPGTKDGAYLYHSDSPAAGGFQNHADGKGWENWCSRAQSEVDPAQWREHLARMAADKKRREIKLAHEREKARTRDKQRWNAAKENAHPYLSKKGILPHGTRVDHVDGEDRLLLPVLDVNGRIHGLQRIAPCGTKMFTSRSAITGHFFVIGELKGEPNEKALQAEGFGTAATLHETTGFPVFVAFDAGNQPSVAKAIIKRYPLVDLLICMDDDWRVAGNPGVTHGQEAADGARARFVKPAWTIDRPEKSTDFDDLARDEGRAVVKAQIDAAFAVPKVAQTEPVTVDAVIVPPSERRSARDYSCTEMGASEFFADTNRADLRYDLERRGWRVWTGSNWRFDVGGVVALERTKAIPEAFLEDARWAVRNDDVRAPILSKFAMHTQKLSVRESILGGAKAERLAVSSSVFDANGDLLNFSDGTYDLAKDVFREHRREDYNTIVLPYAFDKSATAPLWVKTIGEVWPEQEKQQFVQRWIGYCLCRSVKEQKFVFVWGTGANGKTVVLKIFLRLLGDYAGQCPSDIFAISPNDDRARKILPLKDKRLVVTTETQGGQCLDEAMIKSIVSPDTQASRRLYAEVETWEPSAKVVIMGNHKMRTRGGDFATDRRIIFLGCEQRFEGSKCDPDLIDKLSLELPGIMNWAIEGHRQWREHGLGTPSQVQADTRDFCEANDTLAPFFDDLCVPNVEAFVFRTSLYRAYAEWSRAEGNEHPLSPRSFADRVQERGFRIGPKRSIGSTRDRTWEGLSLRSGEGSGQMGTCGQHSAKLFPIASLADFTQTSGQKCPSGQGGVDAPDPLAQIGHCLRVRPGTSASDEDRQALVAYFSTLNGTATAAAGRLWAYWKFASKPSITEFLAAERGRDST